MMGPGGAGMMTMSRADPRLFTRTEAKKESLPLAADFFSKPRLSTTSIHEYEHVAQALLREAVSRSRKERIYGGVDDSWRDIGAMNGFKRHTKVEGQAQHYRIQGVVRAPMANVMSMLYAERSGAIVDRRKVFYGNALDGQTLSVLRERTPADPHQFMALRWEAINIATATDYHKFDSCFLEYTGVTLDKDRHPIGFKISHSMDLPQCQSLLKSHGLTRLEGTEVMTLRATPTNNYTEITIEGSFELENKLPSSAIGEFLTQISQQLGKVPIEIQARRLAAMPIIDKSRWVPTNERKNCSVCLSRFGMMGKKHHCRSCGEVICKSCVVTRPHREEDKFCKKCVVVACAEDELVIPDRGHTMHTPSSQSSRSSSSSTRRREARDSYASSHYSDSDPLSASVFNPHAYQPSKAGVKMAAGELKHLREDNGSMTASETDYGSTFSSSGCFNESVSGDSFYQPRPEDSMIYLDTRSMMRTAIPVSSEPVYPSSRGGQSSRTAMPPPPPLQQMEESLAHQRHLLQEMMNQASRSYRPAQQVNSHY